VGLPDARYSDVQIVKFEFEKGEFIVGNVTICDTSSTYPRNFYEKLHNNVGCLKFKTNRNKEFKGGNDKFSK
jgi:hypothetical protein